MRSQDLFAEVSLICVTLWWISMYSGRQKNGPPQKGKPIQQLRMIHRDKSTLCADVKRADDSRKLSPNLLRLRICTPRVNNILSCFTWLRKFLVVDCTNRMLDIWKDRH